MARELNGTGASGSPAEQSDSFNTAGERRGWRLWWQYLRFGKDEARGADKSREGSEPPIVRRPYSEFRERRGEVGSVNDLSADYASVSEMGEYRITAKDVRGLQIGERNLQINAYEYEVEGPDIDFAGVLSRAEVREALKALSADPNNVGLQREADRLLAEGPLFRKEPEFHVEQSTTSSEGQSSLLEAFIFVRRCQGVQIANDATQKNRFVYVVAPTWDARQLLADDANVRAALISCVCSTDVARSEDILRDELAGVLEDTILNSPDIRTTGDAFRLSAGDSVDVVGGHGVQVNIGSTRGQENKARAVVVVPGSVVRPVRDERDNLEKDRARDEKELSGGEDLGGPEMLSLGLDADEKEDRWRYHEELDRLFARGRDDGGRDRHSGGFDRGR